MKKCRKVVIRRLLSYLLEWMDSKTKTQYLDKNLMTLLELLLFWGAAVTKPL